MMNHDFSTSAVVNTKITVGATSTTVIVATGKRRYAYIVNVSDETIYLALGATAVQGEGIGIPAGTAYELGGDYPYKGVINAICASGSKDITLFHA